MLIIKNMKANRHKGSGRPGASIHYKTVVLKKAASYCGEKIMETIPVRTQYKIDTHNNIMQQVFRGTYKGNDMHYRKQAAYYANR